MKGGAELGSRNRRVRWPDKPKIIQDSDPFGLAPRRAGRPSLGDAGWRPVFWQRGSPALPIATFDPVVYPWQLPDYPGNEVIEITIDQRGDIVRKTVLQSLGPDIDSKCLAALDNWRFQPATRNGAPIPSKQDAISPFKARGYLGTSTAASLEEISPSSRNLLCSLVFKQHESRNALTRISK